MSKTLNLVELLLNSGRNLSEIGRTTEAIDVLTRLADFRKLPSYVIEEIQALLADLYVRREDYPRARRHLTAAMSFHPLKAEYHYLMAQAIERDEWADLKRAEMYYSQAVEQDPDNAAYWADFGNYLLRLGKRALGLKAIRKAYERGLNNADIVGQVAEALRCEDLFEEAATKLRAALFQNHGNFRFLELWQLHQFHTMRAQQEDSRDARAGRKKGPVILPFSPGASTGKFTELGEKTIRLDPPQSAQGPKSPPIPVPYRRPPKG